MSDFALQFIPTVPGAATPPEVEVSPFASRFIPQAVPAPENVEQGNVGLLQRAADALGYTDDTFRNRTAVLEQLPAGLTEGGAQLAGTPVDLTTMAINAGTSGINKLAGTNIPQIENPVGGGGTFQAAVSPFITAPDPQTAGQRYARRIGQELGYGAPIAAMAGGGNLPVMAVNAAADVAAGTAGQTAREIAPESNTLDMIATLLAGGGTAATMARKSRAKPPAPYQTTDEMFEAADELREGVRGSGTALTAPAQRELFDNMQRRLVDERASPRMHPRAYAAIEDAKAWPNASLSDVEETRRVIGRDVAANPDEAAIGMALKDEIDEYLKGLDATKVAGGSDPGKAIADLLASRKLTHQAHKAKAVEGQTYRAKARAARSGRGGNEVNAMRQNVGKILDNEVAPTRPGKRSGYTPDEIAQMEDVNFGTRGQNIGRHIAGFAPTTGNLQAAGGVGTTAAGLFTAGATGNPLFALGAVPPVAGYIAKGLTERSTGKQIEELLDIIRRGGVKASKKMTPTARQALIAQILASGDSLAQQ